MIYLCENDIFSDLQPIALADIKKFIDTNRNLWHILFLTKPILNIAFLGLLLLILAETM